MKRRPYEVGCVEGRFYFRVRRPRPKVTPAGISWWEPWQGPYRSAREAKRQAILALEKRDRPKGWWWKASTTPALWS